MKLKWLNKKEEHLINSPTLREKPETHLETTMDRDMQFTLMETSILETMLTASAQAKENISMQMGIDMKEHLMSTKSMESVDSLLSKKDSITVRLL